MKLKKLVYHLQEEKINGNSEERKDRRKYRRT